MDLANMHVPHVAAVLAAVLVGRRVRAERPYTADEVERGLGEAGGTYGGEMLVERVQVSPQGAIRLEGDNTPVYVDRPKDFTWTVGDEHPLFVMAVPPKMAQAEVEEVIGTLPDSHVLLPGPQAEIRRVESTQLPRRGDQVERWLEQRCAIWEGGSDGRSSVLEGLLDEYRRHADSGTRLDERSAPAAPPSQPGRPSPAQTERVEPGDRDAIRDLVLVGSGLEPLDAGSSSWQEWLVPMDERYPESAVLAQVVEFVVGSVWAPSRSAIRPAGDVWVVRVEWKIP